VLIALLAAALAVAASACSENKGLTITKLDPKTGPNTGGSSVTIYGTGFQSEGAQGVKVYFGDKKARVLSFHGDNQLMVEPPSGEIGQTVDVTLIFDDARQLVYPQAYTYIDPTKGFGVEHLTKDEEKGDPK
jgi:hypothetical protein